MQFLVITLTVHLSDPCSLFWMNSQFAHLMSCVYIFGLYQSNGTESNLLTKAVSIRGLGIICICMVVLTLYEEVLDCLHCILNSLLPGLYAI